MEKLKRYNAILLAVLGTLAVVLLLLFGIYLLTEMFRLFRPDRREETGVLANQVAEQNATDSIRTQVISFNNWITLDTAQGLFLIPAGQAELDGKERLRHHNKFSSGKGNYYNTGVSYNNILFYNAGNQSVTPLFQRRVSVSDISVFKMKNRREVFFSVADTDTNKDGFLNNSDLQKLACFSPNATPSATFISTEEGMTFLQIEFISENLIVGKFGHDRDKNGRFEGEKEPSLFLKIDPESGKSTGVVPVEMLQNLQQRLDGQAN